VRHIRRGGVYVRVADPSWRNPLSGEYARSRGGRWNPPGAFAVVYLNASLELARALIRGRLESRGIRPEDVLPAAGPVLVHTTVPEDYYGNAVTDAGLHAVGLPSSYPLDRRGRVVPHRACQPIGQLAWSAGERGIACRSATPDVPPHGGEELAYFDRQRLIVDEVQAFADWFQ
jgi:RES domain